MAWTTDHWTGSNDNTYSTLNLHFININWSSVSCILDLKVFKGTTTGEAVHNDITHVLQKFQGNNTMVILNSIGITDTTGKWVSWDIIAMRTEGGMCTVQIITSIVMLSLILMVSMWGN